jgi:hypothetical protein
MVLNFLWKSLCVLINSVLKTMGTWTKVTVIDLLSTKPFNIIAIYLMHTNATRLTLNCRNWQVNFCIYIQ